MGRSFPVKRLPDGRALLNLACGTRMHRGWNNLDFSPYARLAARPWLVRLLRSAGFLSPQRQERLAAVAPDILCWDLRRGIPFGDGTFDVVYSSHFVEHLDRKVVPGHLRECHRVLKPGGILRVVVPDLERIARFYLRALDRLDAGEAAAVQDHSRAIDEFFDQMLRDEATGATEQRGWIRLVERAIRGGAARTGELHRWMYDRHSLTRVFHAAGFDPVTPREPHTSAVAGWPEFNLDTDGDGREYIAGSLHLEGRKPAWAPSGAGPG